MNLSLDEVVSIQLVSLKKRDVEAIRFQQVTLILTVSIQLVSLKKRDERERRRRLRVSLGFHSISFS